MISIHGKWSLVTGASRGVGSHVSEGLAQLGSNVVLHSRELSHTRALASRLEALGVKVVTVSGELSDQAQVEAMLDAALRLDNGESGRFFRAQDYAGLSLPEALEKALRE